MGIMASDGISFTVAKNQGEGDSIEKDAVRMAHFSYGLDINA